VRWCRAEVHELDLRRNDVWVERARDRKDPSFKRRVL
jgi:hypothetical protein